MKIPIKSLHNVFPYSVPTPPNSKYLSRLGHHCISDRLDSECSQATIGSHIVSLQLTACRRACVLGIPGYYFDNTMKKMITRIVINGVLGKVAPWFEGWRLWVKDCHRVSSFSKFCEHFLTSLDCRMPPP